MGAIRDVIIGVFISLGIMWGSSTGIYWVLKNATCDRDPLVAEFWDNECPSLEGVIKSQINVISNIRIFE